MKPYYEHGGVKIFHGDCREMLPVVQSVDLLCTDPPYGTGFHLYEMKHWLKGKQPFTITSNNEDRISEGAAKSAK